MGWLAAKGGFLVGADYDVWMRISEMDMSLGVMEGASGMEDRVSLHCIVHEAMQEGLHTLGILAGLT